MKRLIQTAGWLSLALLMSACVDSGPPIDVVAQQADEYMEALKNHDYDKAFSFYSPEFFTTRPREAWRDYLKNAADKLGPMKSFRLAHKRKDTRFSGIFYVFVYKTEYANDNAHETVTFVYPIDSKELKIFAHHIDAGVLKAN